MEEIQIVGNTTTWLRKISSLRMNNDLERDDLERDVSLQSLNESWNSNLEAQLLKPWLS